MGDCYTRYDAEGLALISQKIEDYADEVFLGGDQQGASDVLKFYNHAMAIFRTAWELLDKGFLEPIQRKDA